MEPCVILIVAMDEQRGIGLNNKLPWNIPEDLVHFRNKTLGHPIIMGRKTFESIGRPLPMRQNIVVTRNRQWFHPKWSLLSCVLRNSLEAAISATTDSDIFVIGGAEIFRQALPLADKLIITHVHKTYECDTFFPEIDLRDWQAVGHSERQHSIAGDVDFTISTYVNKDKEKQ